MTPYVIGQWVCGARFYGRRELISTVLSGPPRRHWFAGLRRVGKTSLLRQLEVTVEAAPRQRQLPLFWDLQGAATGADLAASFADALLDAEDHLVSAGLLPSALAAAASDPGAGLVQLGQAAAAQGLELLLLLDEADALLDLAARAPDALGAWWRALDAAAPRVVVTSSVHLADAADDPAHPRHLPALATTLGAPRWLGMLCAEEARALVRQEQLPVPHQPRLAADEIEPLCAACGGHPLLLQMLAKRRLELGDLETAYHHLRTDRSVAYLFAVDFDLLSPPERALLQAAAHGASPGTGPERLVALGLLSPRPEGGLAPYPLLADWLTRSAGGAPG